MQDLTLEVQLPFNTLANSDWSTDDADPTIIAMDVS